MSGILWQPQPDSGARMRALFPRMGVTDSVAAHAWSIAHPDEFWALAWDDLGIIGDRGVRTGERGGFTDTRFLPDARLSVVDTLLAGKDADIVLVGVGEHSVRTSWTRAEVRAQVAEVAAALRAAGVRPGDRVASWTPNVPETAIFALGALSIGALVCTTPTDMAPEAVVDRLAQVEPRVLLVADRHNYGGRSFDDRPSAETIIAGLADLATVVSLEDWAQWRAPFTGAPFAPEPQSMDHPGFILFTSGTTGRPKCIVHSASGVLLKVLTEQVYHLDIRRGDTIAFYSTTGWMMWNWLLMALGAGARIVLIDGSPTWPTVEHLFEVAADEDLTFLGVSAKYLDVVRATPDVRIPELPRLRTLASTGSPLASESFDFVHDHLGPQVQIVSMSGGTDICGCFVLGDPTRPVHRGEIQAAALGMDIDIVDDQGRSVATGATGELICRTPFPSMPLGFWGDDGSRYREAYFARIPGVWTHGDFITRTEHGGYVIHGRSDSTLNVSGVRMGTAEFYQVVHDIAGVSDSVVVAYRAGTDEVIALFVVMDEGQNLTPEVSDALRHSLRTRRSPRHVPAIIESVPAVPRTRSGKLAELAVADAVNGRPIRDISGLANPESLDWFTRWRERQSSHAVTE